MIVGPARWNNVNMLEELELPDGDRQLIATFHTTSRFSSRIKVPRGPREAMPARPRVDRLGRRAQALRDDFDKAAAWGKRHNRPIFLGEFGAYSAADMESAPAGRPRLSAKPKAAASVSPIGNSAPALAPDPRLGQWNKPLIEALVGSPFPALHSR